MGSDDKKYMKKNKYLLLLVFFIIFLFTSAGFAYALEVQFSGLGSNPSFPEYVSFLFTWGISIAGILAVISFALGAIGLISPNIESHNDAKDRMKGAVLGLALTLASFAIIHTINPSLETLNMTPLSQLSGVYLAKGSDLIVSAQSYTDTSKITAGYNTIKYTCTTGTGPNLLVWMFPETNLEQGTSNLYSSSVTVQRIKCGGSASISGKSLRMAFETPGVYYCMTGCGGDNLCQGYMSDANITSQDQIAKIFQNNVKGVMIVSDKTNQLYYGAILHRAVGLASGGACNIPVFNTTDDTACKPIPFPSYSSAANIYAMNKTPLTSGDGVDFFSEEFGPNTGAKAGFFNQTASTIPFSGIVPDANTLIFSWTNIDQPDTYKNKYTNFQSKPGSIRIKGSYLVGLYSGEYCQTFEGDQIVANLNAQPIVASGGTKIQKVYMIPLNRRY